MNTSVKLLTNLLKSNFGKSPFALLYRPHITGSEYLEVITGELCWPDTLESIPVSTVKPYPSNSTLVVVPYNQLKEREFAYVEDDAKLIALCIAEHEVIAKEDVVKLLPDLPITFTNNYFNINDEQYAEVVGKIIRDEIGTGAGSNFVIKRDFIAELNNYSLQMCLTIFRHLLKNEMGAHWTFLIHTGERTLIGASPELHIGLNNNIAVMNPISGTYRYPLSGPTLDGVIDFLLSLKEKDELCMVLEEELKMTSRIFPLGGEVYGPFLKEMSQLAHTEFYIKGRTSCNPKTILRETMFSPAVTGSPIENACRVIKKYEQQGRGYYAGIAALLGQDAAGNDSLDSAILIRTADIAANGRVKIGVGATIVSHSVPPAEAAETRAKVMALLHAMGYRGTSNV